MINFKDILAAVKITNTNNGKIFYLQKNFDRFFNEEKKKFDEEKFLTSHSGFFSHQIDDFHKKIFHKKNFYLEKNFEIEYLYLDNFFGGKKIFRTNEKNLEKFAKNFTKEIRSNFFFTEASFFTLLNKNFDILTTYRISPKNYKIGLNDFKFTPLKKFLKGKFFIYPFQILEKSFLDYITKKIDSYFGEKIFNKKFFIDPVKNTNYVNFFSEKYEFFAYLKFKEILEEIFLEKFGKDLKKDFLNLKKRFFLDEKDIERLLKKDEKFLIDEKNFQEFLKKFQGNYDELKNFDEEIKKNLEKISHKNKIIRFEDDFSKFLKDKNEKEFGFLEYKIDDNLSFKYIFGDKIKENEARFLEEDFSKILGKKFKNNSKKLTPDISLEINFFDKKTNKTISKKIFFDVKFSSFKDFDLKLDYPNPKYFKSDLHKYRKIGFQNQKDFQSKADKIFLLYPGNITEKNFDKFKKLNHLIEKSYNMSLIPIYQGFKEKEFLRDYLKEKFFKEIEKKIK
ncbi:hypothetical protein LR002_02625 [Candidatus Gracilibacteria bacterium]|nr:hypothetical protein [Candidatus Gracilibacteria bacterium]